MSWEVESNLINCPKIDQVTFDKIENFKQNIIDLKKNKHEQIERICLICDKKFLAHNDKRFYCSASCGAKARRKVNRPTKAKLEKLLWEKPTIKIAQIFGVTDKAVEKWAKKYGLAKPPRGYWQKLNKKP